MKIERDGSQYYICDGEYYLHHDGTVHPGTCHGRTGRYSGYYSRRSHAAAVLDQYNGHQHEIGGEG